MKKYVTYIISLALAAAIFTSCAKAAQTHGAANSQGGDVTVSAQAASGGALAVLQKYSGYNDSMCNDKMCFIIENIIKEGNAYLTYIDFEDMPMEEKYFCFKEGCAHDNTSCDAYMFASTLYPLAVTEDAIYWRNANYAAPRTIYKTALDGSSMEVAITYGGETVALATTDGESTNYSIEYMYDTSNDIIITDGDYYYAEATRRYNSLEAGGAAGQTPIETRSAQLWRIDPATQARTVIYETPAQMLWGMPLLIGCTDTHFIIGETSGLEADTGSLSGNAAQVTHSIFLLSKDGGEKTPIMQYKPGDYFAANIFGATLLTVSADKQSFEAINLATGEAICKANGLPQGDSIYTASIADNRAFISVSNYDEAYSGYGNMYAIDLNTADVTQVSLTRLHSGQKVPIEPMAQVKDSFVVPMEERNFMVTTAGTDGAPYAYESSANIYALINTADYFNGTANYRDVKMLPR